MDAAIDEADFAACAATFAAIARHLLADPSPARWSGELTPLVAEGRVWALGSRYDDDDGPLFAALPLRSAGPVAAARLADHLAADRSRRLVCAPGDPPLPIDGDVRIAGAWTLACPEYQAIRTFYGEARARRSQAPLIHHIDEGIAVLRAIGAAEVAIRGYCLHPLVQADAALRASWAAGRLDGVDPRALVLAVEYRAVANGFLSAMEDHPGFDDPAAIRRSPLAEVDAMLIADKIQNAKDFALHHRESHPRAAALARYFDRWLAALGVSPAEAAALTARITLPTPRLSAPAGA